MKVALLREATSLDHEDVENAVPLMDPMLDLAAYRAILRQMHGIVALWEGNAENAAPVCLRGYLRERRRLHLLENDIRHLGGAPEDAPRPALPALSGDAGWIGAMYVMEGSRLGGLLIASSLEATLGLRGGWGYSYFVGYGNRTGAMWKEFLHLVESHIPDSDAGEAICAAKAMFQTFGSWMRRLDRTKTCPGAATRGR